MGAGWDNIVQRIRKKGFTVNYFVGVDGFTGSMPIMIEKHEKSVLSVTIMPCKKVALAIVECYDVPPKKFVKYRIMGPHQMEEIEVTTSNNVVSQDTGSQDTESQNDKQTYVVSTPGQSIKCANVPEQSRPSWCGTCNKH